MTLPLAALAVLTVAAAVVAFALRPLLRSVLLLVATWSGIAVFFLASGAEFLAFAQFLVYAGAVSMVALFAVLLTRSGSGVPAASASPDAGAAEGSPLRGSEPAPLLSARAGVLRATLGLAAGAAVFALLAGAVLRTPLGSARGPRAVMPVAALGDELMHGQGAALLVLGVILTSALIGAVTLASEEAP